MTERQFAGYVEEVPVDFVMGSDSDIAIVEQAANTLDSFGVEYDAHIISAHRTHEKLDVYTRSIRERKMGL